MSSLVGFPQHLPSFLHLPFLSKTAYQYRSIPPRLDFDKLVRKRQDSASTLIKINSSLGGLRTPPTDDDMSAAYHNPVAVSGTYDSHLPLSRHTDTMMPSSRAGGSIATASVLFDPPVDVYSRSQSRSQHASQVLTSQALRSQPGSVTSRTSTQLSSPTLTGSSSDSTESTTVSGEDSSMVMHNLKLPLRISSNGGSLDEFAALMTCFFWFETMDTIQAAEHINTNRPSGPLPPLSKYTSACPAYKKWVNGILTTTQVTQNVVFLALLFVYRLKKTNPRVHGNPGSEYRLLTVALMLGNKFLDDNTYTNKTWAEVSGLSVKEIHVMEVEFLSNMRYGLLTSKEQWQEWLDKLACFHTYCEQARVDEAARQVQVAPLNLSPRTFQEEGASPPLPSPTTIFPTMQCSPSRVTAFSPVSSPHNGWDNTYHSTPVMSPLAAKAGLGLHGARKRSLDGSDAVEPAPKKLSRPQNNNIIVPSITSMPSGEYPVRLPAPHLTLDISQALLPNACGPSYQPQVMVPLPPIKPGMRAMSTVYTTPTTSTWPQQERVLPTCGPQTPSFAVPHYGTPTKRHSPPGLSAYGSSPLADVYASHTPISNSPSVYLQQRPSPYKPVRRVNTLLNPPPSIPLSEYHLGSSQMHYQPLGRRNDLRSGIVPEFLSACAHQRQHCQFQ